MSDFLKGSLSSSTSPADMAVKKEQIMNSVRQEIALINAQELMNKSTDRCFSKCVTKPGSSLSNSEQTCIGNCMDRYFEAFNIVSRTYTSRARTARLEAQ
ncbi:Mitochondrial import inner membrane translocase subunit Tim13-B [Hypsizygus marmoreus]|uniref:Mitochondrial import inner membrane translocase subunit n=1 Tax=Hypsizygus marmoreus TaxID=39966 RepID=A0A369KGQ9_HYPMA|nr:Mitochondrial import inner membrane translocase subunit Tim13-B [Hypsizygus marmoreus]